MSIALSKLSVIYSDVDGTLVFWPGGKPGRPPRAGEPGHGLPPDINQPLVDALKKWYRPGKNTLVFWSRGGAQHCREIAKLIGIQPDACLPKPYAVIDDAPKTVRFDNRKGYLLLDPRAFK